MGARDPDSGRKIVYCHSPAKWLYRPGDYLGNRPTRGAQLALSGLTPFLRRFDRRAASTADTYVANSTFIAAEIEKAYGIPAEVVHPPPGLAPDGPRQPLELNTGFLLTVARLLPYKNVSQVIDSFRLLPDQELVVVGDGPERARLASSAPRNVQLVGNVADDVLRWLFANSAGLIAASREDFGLTPLEAASFGKPTAALRWGGFLDTVTSDTGVFFSEPGAGEIATAVGALLERDWDTSHIRAYADSFSEAHFIDQMRRLAE